MMHVQKNVLPNGSLSRKRPFEFSLRGLRKFLTSTAGNLTVTFAVSAVPVIGFTGAAVEFTEYSRVRTNMLEALDAAGLAISQKANQLGYDTTNLSQEEEEFLKNFGRDFFEENFTSLDRISNYGLDFTIGTTTVTPAITGKINTTLLSVLGFDHFSMNSQTEITLAGSGKLEVVMVLDVTGSMGWCPSPSGGYCDESRMDVLKDAVDDMLDQLIGTSNTSVNEDVKVGIVPFNYMVNIGADNAGIMDSMDTDALSYYHGINFIHMTAIDDVDASTKVNLFNLLASDDDTDDEMEWGGCVEARPYPLDEYDTAPGTSAPSYITTSYDDNPLVNAAMEPTTIDDLNAAFNNAPEPLLSASELTDEDNSWFVPLFWPDEPENGSRDCDTGEYEWIYDCSNDNGWSSSYYNGEFIDDSDYVSDSSSYYSSSAYHEQYESLVKHFRVNMAYELGYVTLGDSVTEGQTCVNTGSRRNPNWVCTELDDNYTSIEDPDVVTYANRLEVDWDDYRNEEFRIRQAYVGMWDEDTETYKGKYDTGIDVSYYSNGLESYGPNTDCNAPIQPLTSSRASLNTAMDALTPHGSTNTAVGAIWGWRVLSDIEPFTQGVDQDTTEGAKWSKAMILMTDGNNSFSNDDNHNLSLYTPYGYGYQNRLNLDYDDDRTSSYDSDQDNEFEAEFDRKTLRICARMRAEGIKVYTVGFAIAEGSNADNMLKACATSGDDYYLADDAEELSQSFQDITDNLVNLHVSG